METRPFPMRALPLVVGVDAHGTILTPRKGVFQHQVAEVYNRAAGTRLPAQRITRWWAEALETVGDAVGVDERYQICNAVILSRMNPGRFSGATDPNALERGAWIREQVRGKDEALYTLTARARKMLRRLRGLADQYGFRLVMASNQDWVALQRTVQRWPSLREVFHHFYIHDRSWEGVPVSARMSTGLGVAKPDKGFVTRLLAQEAPGAGPARYIHVGNSWRNDALLVVRSNCYGIILDEPHRYFSERGTRHRPAQARTFREVYDQALSSRRICVVHRHLQVSRLVEATIHVVITKTSGRNRPLEEG